MLEVEKEKAKDNIYLINKIIFYPIFFRLEVEKGISNDNIYLLNKIIFYPMVKNNN